MSLSDEDLRRALAERSATVMRTGSEEPDRRLGPIARAIATSPTIGRREPLPGARSDWALLPRVAAVIVIAFLGLLAIKLPPSPSGDASTTPRITRTVAPSSQSVAPTPTAVAPAAAPFRIVGCEDLEFSAVRCAAVVARARESALPPLRAEDITAATVARPEVDYTIRASFPIAAVSFALVGGGSAEVEVRCGLPGNSDRACNPNAAIFVRGGIDQDVPCAGEAPEHACATLPPSPRPASIKAAEPLRVSVFDLPLDHLGRYEILIGIARLPDGVMVERSARLADTRPTTLWIDDGVAIDVRSDISGRPPIGSVYRDPYDGPEPVKVYLVFDVVELKPGAVLQVRDLVVR
ncbi:MAG: hypothetical protein H0U52_02060 [Chloroflexi bacterium]|nr:hypothetical protein [Chloroflexota bacterium]